MLANKTVYFGGSGFRCAFYIGCMKALQERWPNQYPKQVHADSAGSMVALGYALGVPWHRLEVIYYTCLENQRRDAPLASVRLRLLWGLLARPTPPVLVLALLVLGTEVSAQRAENAAQKYRASRAQRGMDSMPP